MHCLRVRRRSTEAPSGWCKPPSIRMGAGRGSAKYVRLLPSETSRLTERYDVAVTNLPPSYAPTRQTLGFDEISYGVGGIEIYPVHQIEAGQIGYSVDPRGMSLVGDREGDWREEWIVIGHETTCGDPIILLTDSPYPVFTAIHGQGTWDLSAVAPSLEQFWRCLHVYRLFAAPLGGFIDEGENARSPEEIDEYISQISSICEGDSDALFTWALWANIDLTAVSDERGDSQP